MGGRRLGACSGMMMNAEQKHVSFKHDPVISCLQCFFFEVVDVVAPVDVYFLSQFKAWLAANLESIVLHDCELDACEACVNCSTSSSSKVACFVFNAFVSKSSMS
jgi:hypothetical protein